MRKAIIKDGVVANIIVVGEGYEAPEGVSLADPGPGCVVGASFDGSTFTPPAPVAATSEEINAERDRRIAAGMAVTVSVGTFNVQTDPKSREIIAGLSQVGLIRNVSSDTTTTAFRDADNIERTLTPADLVSMGMQVAAMVDSVYKASWTIKARNDLATIDITDDQYWSA